MVSSVAWAQSDETALQAAQAALAQERAAYDQGIRGLIETYCWDCHSTAERQGELDLERFPTGASLHDDLRVWQQVQQMVGRGEMPPADSEQPTEAQRQRLETWLAAYLDAEARAQAGDPGPVVLRRLNNTEYTSSIQDLTGLPLEPARQFPVDGAAGEGFTNTGQSLVMSPALLDKYVAAAHEVAEHAVLLPDGIRFFPGTTRRDWTDTLLTEIRDLYRHQARAENRVSDVPIWDTSDLAAARAATNEDGRVELVRYWQALLRHRETWQREPGEVGRIASEEQLNARYLQHLVDFLRAEPTGSFLLDDLRETFQAADVEGAAALAARTTAWQDQLFQFNPVGHFGLIRPWQQAVDPIVAEQSLRFPISGEATGDRRRIALVAVSDAADPATRIEWRNVRLAKAGQTPLPITTVPDVVAGWQRIRNEFRNRSAAYLQAAQPFKDATDPPDWQAVAQTHDLHPVLFKAWLDYLGIAASGATSLDDPLTLPLRRVNNQDRIAGWGWEGLDALSIVANGSDSDAKIPGDLPRGRVAVHPRPERWIAAGWQSPESGTVAVRWKVQHAHPACGNGVQWSLEHRSGSIRQVLAEGVVDLGQAATVEPLNGIAVRRGDVIALVIGPRNGDHSCDLTQIDLEVRLQSELDREARVWSLEKDLPGRIDQGNPLTGLEGGDPVWHFFSGSYEQAPVGTQLPPASLLAQWVATRDPNQAAQLATEIQAWLQTPSRELTRDRELAEQLVASDGPFWSKVDLAGLVEAGPVQAEPRGDQAPWGWRLADGTPVESQGNRWVVPASSHSEVILPADLFAGWELQAEVRLADETPADRWAQVTLAETRPEPGRLLVGSPWLVPASAVATTPVRQMLQEFRDLFPAAMCHTRIVPVDEVVTLVLFHREDAYLKRLMLSPEQGQRLDRLWDELHFVSQDALTMLTAYEQLMEFATQDSDPSLFEPLREPIQERAAEFRAQQAAAEPYHWQSVLDFATRAFRRPLRGDEPSRLRDFYQALRDEGLAHDEAIRMTLVRVLTSPLFLYRLETSPPGDQPALVNDWELATRLSYLFWASLPDQELRDLAAAGQLQQPDVLRAQTRRLLQDPRSRRMAIEFGCQWLHLRDFDQFDEKSENAFPEFAELRGEMYEETVRFWESLLRDDGSVLELIAADHTFLNERLATFYGIPNVTGTHWRRVEGVQAWGRGGVLTQASVLAKQSGASRTSPILRGNWVSETLLGERLPRPPKNVPVLPETAPENLTERQLIERHSSDPACAKCHQKIDPYGFSLEAYDGIGRRRSQDGFGHPIDTQTTLMDGVEIDGVAGLQAYLLEQRRDDVIEQFCHKLIGYGLGRSVQLSDELLIRSMKQALAENDYRISVALEHLVLSPQFRSIRGQDQADEPLASDE